jgi:hypothetical protein
MLVGCNQSAEDANDNEIQLNFQEFAAENVNESV